MADLGFRYWVIYLKSVRPTEELGDTAPLPAYEYGTTWIVARGEYAEEAETFALELASRGWTPDALYKISRYRRGECPIEDAAL